MNYFLIGIIAGLCTYIFVVKPLVPNCKQSAKYDMGFYVREWTWEEPCHK